MNLHEWTLRYIKHRDLFQKKLKECINNKEEICCTYSNYTRHYLLKDNLEDGVLKNIHAHQSVVVVCRYTQENLNFVLAHWKDLVKHHNLLLIFVEPDREKKWLLNPSAHHKIADPETLTEGLQSMFLAGFEE